MEKNEQHPLPFFLENMKKAHTVLFTSRYALWSLNGEKVSTTTCYWTVFSGMTTCAEVLRFQRFLLGSCLALVVLSFSSLALADCPEVCTCKWKGGKQTVECINASLSSIPNIEAGTQVLDLGLNYLPTLRTDTFKRNNLTNLQKIYLNQCSLRLLEVHTFR